MKRSLATELSKMSFIGEYSLFHNCQRYVGLREKKSGYPTNAAFPPSILREGELNLAD